MPAEHTPLRVYHVGPWRYWWIWLVFGPISLVFLGASIFVSGSNERAGFLFGGGMFLGVTLLVHFLVRFARLELSAEGVRLRQVGYRLEAPWSDIADLWLDRGHEGLVTSRPVSGKGAALLAASGRTVSSMPIGMSFYTGEQQALLNEGRLIPIEAFVWHLRHGKLRADLEHFAPNLRPQLASLDAPPAPTHKTAPRKQPARPFTVRDGLVIALLVLGIAGMLAFGASSKKHAEMLGHICTALFSGSFALSLGIGARNCYRIGSWLAGTGLAIVSILLALWAFAELSKLAEGAGHAKLAPQLFALLFLGTVAFLLGHGARKAFHRHRRVVGTLFLLAAAFPLLCAVFTLLDVLKSLH